MANKPPANRNNQSKTQLGARQRAAQENRERILRTATKIFARSGFSGGRIDQISKAANTHDRMIYYYFGSKEGLYVAVLEDMYDRFNKAEAELVLGLEDPIESLKVIASFIWSYYSKNPEFITLLNDENLHRGRHVAKSKNVGKFSPAALQALDKVLKAGAASGVLRGDVSARDAYIAIASLNYFYLSNRFTLSAFFGEKLDVASSLQHWHDFAVDAVPRLFRKD